MLSKYEQIQIKRQKFREYRKRRVKMKIIDEKYRIKPRKKYQRQVWLKDGKAIIVDPLDPSESNNDENKKEE